MIPDWLKTLAAWIECAIEEHKAVSRLTLAWIVCLITWATFKHFADGGTPAAYASLAGLLTVAVGFYQWRATK